MTRFRSIRLAVVVAVCCLFAGSLLAADAAPAVREPGDLWEITSQVTMEGMPMAIPAQKNRVCSPKGSQEPPGVENEQQKCKATEFKTVGNKTSWKVKCDGPPPMSGEGEITRSGADAYSGSMKMTAPQGVVSVKLDGKRVGDCDASETKRQVAQMQAQSDKIQHDTAVSTAAMCKSAVIDGMNYNLLTMQDSPCSDPALKAQFCERLGTEEGYGVLDSCDPQPSQRLAEAAAYCGKDPATLRSGLCTSALQKESLQFLAKCCPAQAKGIAEKECAGRAYTSLGGSKYQSFCATYAMHAANAEAAAATPAAEAKPESKTKKALKGLFKR